MTSAIPQLHLGVCRRFGDAVRSGEGNWDRPSPCEAWNARGVLEHVIGFHDVLLLRPLGLKPDRPRDEPQRRWELTFDRLCEAFAREELFESATATAIDAPTLVPLLTRDVLVHAWDLARAVGADDRPAPRRPRRVEQIRHVRRSDRDRRRRRYPGKAAGSPRQGSVLAAAE